MRKAITNPAAREKWKETGDHGDRCQVCNRPWERSGWRGLTIHHIIHGCGGRSDEPCNFLLACGRCHDMIHDGQYRDEATKELLPTITLGMVLWIKSRTLVWKPRRLQELYFRKLPAWEILPAYYMNERAKWRAAA